VLYVEERDCKDVRGRPRDLFDGNRAELIFFTATAGINGLELRYLVLIKQQFL